MSSPQLRQKHERPAKTRRDAARRAALLARKRDEMLTNTLQIDATVDTEDFYARKQENRAFLAPKTPGSKALDTDYYRFVFKHDNQHCVLRTKATITEEAVESILSGADDDVCASALGDSIIFDDDDVFASSLGGSVHWNDDLVFLAQIGANLRKSDRICEESPKRARVESHMLAHVLPMNTLPKDVIDTLERSNSLLDVAWPSRVSTKSGEKKGKDKRGDFPVRHIACWFKASRHDKPWMNVDFVGSSRKHIDKDLAGLLVPSRIDVPVGVDADIEYFLRTNDRLWKLIDSLVKNYYPKVYDVLQRLELPEGCVRVAGIFCGLALNTDVRTQCHRDSSDWPFGVCVVVSYGDATGGELALQEQVEVQVDGQKKTFSGVILPGLTGSITIFRSALVRHFNVPYTGKRNSIVLFTDNRLMLYGNNQQFRGLRLE